MSKDHNYAVIVAGGSGTRLWPISRQELPKQMQSLVSQHSLLEDTYERLQGVYSSDHILVSTTVNYVEKIKKILPDIPEENFVVEPTAKGPALAFALFAEVLYRRDPKAIIFSMASDHAIAEKNAFQTVLGQAHDYIGKHPDRIALVGVKPTRPDTGLGYIKVDTEIQADPCVYSVEKFIEKPSYPVAKRYAQSSDFFWNVAYYCFSAKTLLEAYNEASPRSVEQIRAYVDSNDVADFEAAPKMVHEIEVVNARKFPLVLIPAEFHWDDIGNWSALHDLLADANGDKSRVISHTPHHIDVDSQGCMVRSENPDKLIATVGLENLIIVDTADSLLVMHKGHSQDIKTVIEEIKQRGLEKYL
ncbi:mannose-1-phosphate guanylyltransferase [Candidatus Saccharibacteria bacterium]|nr:MAG: mannose-1-phosphate guanylyltransferase [Candidatus Saccharibacteria bacterium]